jgi:hypothetical protein
LNEYVVNIGSLLFIIAGLTSLLFFVKGRGRGFVFLGTGFLLLGVGTVVNHYLPQILDFERSSDAFQLSVTSLLIISSVVSSILMLGGLLFLYKDFRKNA